MAITFWWIFEIVVLIGLLRSLSILEAKPSYRHQPNPASGSKAATKEPSNHSVNQTWRRDLCAEGIEPNPGPGHFNALSLNCGSRDNTWSIANMLCDQKVMADVVCLQETFLDPGTGQTMVHKLGLAGYRLWTTEPKQSGGQYRGGVAMVINSESTAFVLLLCASRPSSCSSFVVSLWKGHEASEETEDFLAFLEEMHLQALSQGIPIALLGDWNWQPHENLLLQDAAFTFVAVQEGEELLPTRWQGRRAIDYALLSPNMLGNTAFMVEAFGDHKGVAFQLQCALVEGQSYARVPTRRFRQPDQMTRQQWRSALAEAWVNENSQVPPEKALDADGEWLWFNTKLEQTFSKVEGGRPRDFCAVAKAVVRNSCPAMTPVWRVSNMDLTKKDP